MSFRLSRRNRFLQCLTGLFLLLPALPSHAFSACVGTAQQLHDALANVALSGDAIVVIKLRTGTYIQTAGTGNFSATATHSNQTVEISGGWSGPNNSCQNKSFDAADTILVGGAYNTALYLSTGNAVSGSVLSAHDLTLANDGYAATGFGACLMTYVSANNEAVLERLQMVECLAPNSSNAAGYLENTGGLLTMRNVYVRSSLAKSNGGLSVSTYSGGTTRLSHLSITNTASTGSDSLTSGLYLANFSDSFTYLSNSVIWGNDPDAATMDLYTFGSGMFLTRVHHGKRGGVPTSNISPSTGDPGFANYNDPHLRADSILIDSGVANPVGGSGTFDAGGRTRVLGGAVDVGAFESDLLFANGFQAEP